MGAREPPPELRLDRRYWQHGAYFQPYVRSWHRLLGLRKRHAQPVFQGGTLVHKERAAKAAYTQAAEQYRSNSSHCFRKRADALNALQQDAEGLKAATTAKDAAGVTLGLVKKQLESGYANNLAVLSAKQAYQQALINLTQAQANRYADTAALFQALGGGWWNRPDLPKE